jgi:site-specific recombinase XerD
MARAARYALNKNKYLLPFEVDRLRSILKSFETKDARNCLLIELGLATGARATEILNIQRSDLNEEDQSVFIHGIKGSDDREIPLKSSLFRRVIGLPGDRLFPISYDRLYQIWDLYRPVPKKFHSLRHTFAIELYTRTKDIRLLQVALGHRNITNTMIYADYLYSKQELRKLIVEL